MLLLGNKRYPDPLEFKKFLATHGGYMTGETRLQESTYVMHVGNNSVAEALERFGHCFISPLFESSTLLSKRNELEEEYSRSGNELEWYWFLLLSSLANAGHPLHQFSKLDSKINTLDVGQEMVTKFHKSFYSANTMRLVVRSRRDLGYLEKTVGKVFSQIKNLKLPVSPYKLYSAALFSPKDLGKLYQVGPVSEPVVRVTYVLNITALEFTLNACKYVIELLRTQGTGSLHWYLTSKGYCTDIRSAVSLQSEDFIAVSVDFVCTTLGLMKHQTEILQAFYGYLALIKKSEVLWWFLKELDSRNELNFLFSDSRFNQGKDAIIAVNMQRFKAADVLIKTYMNEKFNVEELKRVLAELVPEKSLVFAASTVISGKRFKDHNDFLGEPFRFQVQPIKSKDFKNARPEDYFFSLPKKNRFLAESIGLLRFHPPVPATVPKNAPKLMHAVAKTTQTSTFAATDLNNVNKLVQRVEQKDLLTAWKTSKDRWRPPVLIEANRRHMLWYKQDTSYKQPKVVIAVLLSSAKFNRTVRTRMICEIYSILYAKIFTKRSSYAIAAGIEFSSHFNSDGFELSVFGFSDKIEEQLSYALASVKDISNIEEADFNEAIYEVKRKYGELFTKDVLTWNLLELRYLQQDAGWKCDEKLRALDDITFLDVLEAGPLLFEDMVAEILVHGNATEQSAHTFSRLVTKTLLSSGTKQKEGSRGERAFRRLSTAKLDYKTEYFYILPSIGPSKTSSMIMSFHLDLKPSQYYKGFAAFLVLSILMSKAYTKYLEKHEYSPSLAEINLRELNGVLVYEILMASDLADTLNMFGAAEAFLNDFEGGLNKIDGAVLTPVKTRVLQAVLDNDRDLYEESTRWWDCIKSGLYDFSNRVTLGKELKALSLNNVRDMYRTFLGKDGNRSLLVSGVLAQEKCQSLGLVAPKENRGTGIIHPFGTRITKALPRKSQFRVVHIENAKDFRLKSEYHMSPLEKTAANGMGR